MELKILIVLHTIGACVWVGGHLILSISILPKAWKAKDHKIISSFEESFERIGIPSLIIQVITGIRLAMIYVPISNWFDISSPLSKLILIKLVLLLCTVGLAIHARFFIIPKLNASRIALLGGHILAVTIIGILFLITGLSFRLGIL